MLSDNKKKIEKILKNENACREYGCELNHPSTVEALLALCESIRAEALKEVGIGEEQNQGSDEAYCDWFECPKCKDTMITSASKFCPNCGVKFKWLAKLSQEEE